MKLNTGDTAYCQIEGCRWQEKWTTADAMRAAAVWHVFDTHRPLWLTMAGPREPLDSRPVWLGQEVTR